MNRRLWALPCPKPVDRKRYVFGVDDLALALGITALTGGAAAGAGMLANQNRKGGGYDIIYPKQPSYSEPRMRLTSDFITQNLQRINESRSGQHSLIRDYSLTPLLRPSPWPSP